MTTNEDSINSLTQFASSGSHMSFYFLQWFSRHREKAKHADIQKEEKIITDACSRYRGGYYDPINEKVTAGLMKDLSGGKMNEPAPFIFLGNRSDLSVFWQVSEPGRRTITGTSPDRRVVVPRKMIEDIPDEKIRQNTITAFAKAQADGLVDFDAYSYSITEAGKKYITKSDFITGRLKAEYKFFCTAESNLEQEMMDQEASEKEAWIDARLREKGIDPENYTDCYRITIDRKSLEAELNGDKWLTYVPHTGRAEIVSLPKDSVVELNEKTLVAFLYPNQTYKGSGKNFTGAELMSYFDDKSRSEIRRPSVETVEKTASKVYTGSFDTDEFFDKAVNAGLRRHLEDEAVAKLKAGATVYAPDIYKNDLNLCEYYIIKKPIVDTDGQIWYKLNGVNLPEQILPEEALDKFMFTDFDHGKAYLAEHADEAADYADELLARIMGERLDVPEAEVTVNTYTLTVSKDALVSETEDVCRIKIPDKQVEQMIVPAKDVVKEGSKLEITLYDTQKYKVITGAYGYEVTGNGLSKLSGAAVHTSTAAAQTAAVTETTAATTSVNAAIAAIPIPEPVTMGAKTLYAAAAQTVTQSAVQTAAQTTVQTSLKLTQSIGKEG